MDRRTFITSALSAGVSLGLGLAGCGSRADTDVAEREDERPSAEAADGGAQPPQEDVGTPAATAAGRSVVLNCGVEMPTLGLGTYILTPSQAEESVYAALMAGTRLIDTARIYGNEEGVGRGIARAGVPREEVFLTTKLWTADYQMAAAAIDASLARLGVDYVDLLLLHHEDQGDEEAYRAMEDAYEAGKVRSIGISNYYEEGYDRIRSMARIAPAVLQNETHPYFQERDVKDHLAAAGALTVLESWFPLGGKDNCQVLFADETIAEVAANHAVSPAQALIRWHLQSGNVCIPGSSNPDHIREDADVFGFELTPDEMAAVDAIERGERLAWY